MIAVSGRYVSPAATVSPGLFLGASSGIPERACISGLIGLGATELTACSSAHAMTSSSAHLSVYRTSADDLILDIVGPAPIIARNDSRQTRTCAAPETRTT